MESAIERGLSTEPEPVLLRVEGPVATITLNRPEVHNCGNLELIAALVEATERVQSNETVRVVVLRGSGRSFSSGIDLKVVSTGAYDFDWFRRWERAISNFETMEKISVAAIHGYCLGGGLQLALACDLRITRQDSSFGLPAAIEGLVPGLGPYRLPRYIGLGRAKWMTLTGGKIDAWTAQSWGLVDLVARPEEFEHRLRVLVDQLVDAPVTAQLYSKKMLNLAGEVPFDAMVLDYLEWQRLAVDSPDHAKAAETYRKEKGLELLLGGRQ